MLWFREEDPAKPIYTVDLRGENIFALDCKKSPGSPLFADRSLSDARHWSDDSSLQGRGFFQTDQSPGVLVVEGVKAKDRGVYRCRVDFKIQPTTISRVDLAVNMPPEKPVILDSRGREVGRRLGPYRLGHHIVYIIDYISLYITGWVRPSLSPAPCLGGDLPHRSLGGERARWWTPPIRGRSPGSPTP